MSFAYAAAADGCFDASEYTRGPWNADHQHAGPPSALVCRALERAGAVHGLTHLARLTGNLLRPVPIGPLAVQVSEDYVGRNAGHFSARLLAGRDAGAKELARFTALLQREVDQPLPPAAAPLPAPRAPADSAPVAMPFAGAQTSYADLVENRIAEGRIFAGPSSVWFRLRHPLVAGEAPSGYQRVAVAADSGNGISAALDYRRYSFVNCDLTVNLLRRPQGEWICLQARSTLAGNGCGLAESALYDEAGLIGRATQSLAVRER